MSKERRKPPISRNRTQEFAGFRRSHLQEQQSLLPGSEATDSLLGGGGTSSSSAARPRGTDPERNFERATLPPQWVDSADEATEEIKCIRQKIVQLTKAHQRRLLAVFSDDAPPDAEVEAISREISEGMRRCEQCIQHIRNRGPGIRESPADQVFRENMQKKLAAQLTELSKQCREAQKQYMQEIRRRQGGDPETAGGGAGYMAVGVNDRQQQLLVQQEIDDLEAQAIRRSAELCQIANSVNELHSMFKELSILVIEQGSILDRIDVNMEKMVEKGGKTNQQLQKAQDHKKKKDDLSFKVLIALLAANLFVILCLLIKWKIKKGMSQQNILSIVLFVLVALAILLVVARCRPQWLPGWVPVSILTCCWPAPQQADAGEQSRWQRMRANLPGAPAGLAMGLGGSSPAAAAAVARHGLGAAAARMA